MTSKRPITALVAAAASSALIAVMITSASSAGAAARFDNDGSNQVASTQSAAHDTDAVYPGWRMPAGGGL